ncbi:TPM domain-containing protein [Microbacterium gilvum]|uniref:TPM domain-containing protein n=1 Tax=Microbacterium gilvum TaxID=1336204 RepID=A0ABP9ADH5_9MICO
MRARWTAVLCAGLTILIGGTATAALAETPVALGSSRVYDGSDVLTDSEEQAADARLRELSTEEGVDLWVVYVDDFESPSDPLAWADETANRNSLGDGQYLLAIATDGRALALSYPPSGSVGEARVSEIEAAVGAALADDDWAAAVDVAADSFISRGGGGAWPWIIGLVVVAGVVIVVVLLSRRRRTPAVDTGSTPPDAVPVEELQRRAASLLIATDDAVRTSEQELGFAIAQFGEGATGEFRETLAAAKASLARAFERKAQLDDHEKDAESDVRAWNGEIIALCEQANAALDEKAQGFAQLRQLEQNAPEALAQVQEKRSQADGVVAEARQELATLSARYAPEALASVADNPEQAQARLAFADEQLVAAQQAIGAGKGGEAAVAIRTAEQAIAQARGLDTAVSQLGASLAEGEKQAAALIAELEGDVAAAKQLPDGDGQVAGAVARTEQQIATARENLAGAGRRPLLVLEALQKADDEIDRVIAGGREAADRQHRATQLLSQTILQARSAIASAEEFIAARRGGVGADARTRLAQAGADLARAEGLQQADPATALSHARNALQLANDAIASAQRDVGSFETRYPTATRSSGGDDFLGGLLGGLIGSSMGDRRSGSGWGGGGLFGGGGGWSGGGGSRSRGGSFGGGRSSSRGGRSGGRSFGGGGRSGRSGGRRF